MVESVPDDPTYNVSSELTLVVSRSDDNNLITCAVDHPSLAPGDKRSEQALRVLCESPGKLRGSSERGQRQRILGKERQGRGQANVRGKCRVQLLFALGYMSALLFSFIKTYRAHFPSLQVDLCTNNFTFAACINDLTEV